MFIEKEWEHCEYLVAGKLSSPSCRELGIPRDERQPINCCQIQNTSIDIASVNHKVECTSKVDPFSPYCIIPLPVPFGSGLFDPTCIRRRNERERERVRCVNEGYVRLKEHLPIVNKEKRISKVDTLRGAIQYIKYLRKLLGEESNHGDDQDDICGSKYEFSHENIDFHETHNNRSLCENHHQVEQVRNSVNKNTNSHGHALYCERHDTCSNGFETDSESDTFDLSSDSTDTFSDGDCK